MKLPMKWAQAYAPLCAGAAEFAAAMTMTGSKVETFRREADEIRQVVIGRIQAIERHPDSDHLWVCQVEIGRGEGEDARTVQIVTGAQNLKGGEWCPVALHGARLPNGQTIKRGKLRGVASDGMLCSLPELNLTAHDYPGATEEGILVLQAPDIPPAPEGAGPDWPLGADAAAVLGMDDTVFEFEITPNRPDCLSVRGLAREAAATFGVPFAGDAPAPPAGSGDVAALLSARVESTGVCLRYAAAVVDNVRIGPSPLWMRQRLRHAGVRPINNIVDITNYVMLEYGQPMHAFDYAYVNGQKITVRMAKSGEGIVTLDGVRRALDERMLVIADEKGPIAVAGVMGGEYSGVYETTQKVVFESACFDGPSVRATSRELGLRTEASTRFEKGLDPNLAGPALARALQLVAELNAGDIVGGVADDYPAPRAKRTLPLRVDAVNKLLGIRATRQQIVDILRPLGFSVAGDVVTVPTARADVARDCDIAEEVARFIGYDKLPATVLRGTAQASPPPRRRFEGRVAEVLIGCGLWQCETFSFYGPKSFDAIGLPPNSPLRRALKILHPLGEDTSLMRTTAVPSLLEAIARNWAARAEEAALFELATEYRPAPGENELPQELKKMVAAAYGPAWDYAAMKGVAEALLAAAGVPRWEVRRNSEGGVYHPGRCAHLYVQAPGEGEMRRLGTVGEVHPAVLENFDIKPRVVVADLDLDVLFAAKGPTAQYRQLPRFPAVTRDLALVASDDVPAAAMAAAIRKAAGKRLESLSLFDVFTGEKVGDGKKSLAYNLVLRDAGATLTDADADAIIQKVLAELAGLGVTLRGLGEE